MHLIIGDSIDFANIEDALDFTNGEISRDEVARRLAEKNPQELKNIFIVQGNASQLDGLYEDSRSNGEQEYEMAWTCPNGVKKGDLMLVYLMTPISAIVAVAEFSSEPFRNEDSTSAWLGYRMATFENLQMLAPERWLKLSKMRVDLPNWRWTTRPQGAIQVPKIYEEYFGSLV